MTSVLHGKWSLRESVKMISYLFHSLFFSTPRLWWWKMSTYIYIYIYIYTHICINLFIYIYIHTSIYSYINPSISPGVALPWPNSPRHIPAFVHLFLLCLGLDPADFSWKIMRTSWEYHGNLWVILIYICFFLIYTVYIHTYLYIYIYTYSIYIYIYTI